MKTIDRAPGFTAIKTPRAGSAGERSAIRVLGRIILYITLSAFGILMLFPFYWMLVSSLKLPAMVMLIPPGLLPIPIHFGYYIEMFTKLDFLRYTFNSINLVVLTIVGNVVSALVIGFGFAKYRFPGRNLLFMIMLGTMMLPGQVTMIPTYMLWSKLGLVPSIWPLIIPPFMGSAFNIFLLNQHFRSIPNAFYESALIDGARPPRILMRIYVPLSIPVITTIVIFTFIWSWNNTLGPLLYLKDKSQYTLILALLMIKGKTEYADFGMWMAASMITTLPTVIVFLLGQKFFVEGLSSAGVKG